MSEKEFTIKLSQLEAEQLADAWALYLALLLGDTEVMMASLVKIYSIVGDEKSPALSSSDELTGRVMQGIQDFAYPDDGSTN